MIATIKWINRNSQLLLSFVSVVRKLKILSLKPRSPQTRLLPEVLKEHLLQAPLPDLEGGCWQSWHPLGYRRPTAALRLASRDTPRFVCVRISHILEGDWHRVKTYGIFSSFSTFKCSPTVFWPPQVLMNYSCVIQTLWNVSFSLTAFKAFQLIFVFWQFDYDLPKYGFLHHLLTWCTLSCLNL